MQRVLGLMSGTSMDGVDVAWLMTDGREAIEAGPAITMAYREDERNAVKAVLGSSPGAAGEMDRAVQAVTEAHIRAIGAFFDQHPALRTATDLIGFHGQTTFHDPANGVTVQIGDAAALAAAFDLPVVHDFRTADVATGGQGAPLAPLYHQALSAGLPRPLAVLNLGGVGNVTWIGEDDALLAFDTGPANALIDDWVKLRGGVAYDAAGAFAYAGYADRARISSWLQHPYFALTPPKSLDRNAFAADVSDLSLSDGAATLGTFTVLAVARSLEHMPEPPRRWLVTGGGRHNIYLMTALAQELGVPVDPVEAVGWDGDALEAQAFAWLAARSLEGLPLSLPATTGVRTPQTGGVLVKPHT